MKKIAIFIPTYNAARTLPVVLDRIPPAIKNKVQEIFIQRGWHRSPKFDLG